jgi:cold shock CspA family protein
VTQGIIRKKVDARGFAFIEIPDSTRDIFFHFSDCDSEFADIQVGDAVEFEIAMAADGRRKARRVRRV